MRLQRLLAVVVALAFLGCGNDGAVTPEPNDPECLDFTEYVSWAGAVGTPAFALAVVIVGEYAFVAAAESGGWPAPWNQNQLL